MRPLASLARFHAPFDPALLPTLGTELARNGVALQDDASASNHVHGGAVEIADHVGLTSAPARDDPREQGRSDVAQRRGVMFAGLDHQTVVAGCKGGTGPASLIRVHEQRLPQAGIPTSRRPP
jgi:hypothetical protein